jgi:V/A-type H+-transporting ATPase subunit D
MRSSSKNITLAIKESDGMAAFGERVSATPGILLRLREQLEFIQKAKNILEMKRDHLAAEVNKLLRDLSSSREEAEKSLTEAYDYLKISYSKLGHSGFSSVASSVGLVDVRTSVRTIIGVEVPKLIWPETVSEQQGSLENLLEPTARQAAEKLLLSLGKWLKLAEVEASVERISVELMMTNRKVNALQNIVIPNLTQLITRIEEQLEEEDLEDFFKAKKMKSIIRGKRR